MRQERAWKQGLLLQRAKVVSQIEELLPQYKGL